MRPEDQGGLYHTPFLFYFLVVVVVGGGVVGDVVVAQTGPMPF